MIVLNSDPLVTIPQGIQADGRRDSRESKAGADFATLARLTQWMERLKMEEIGAGVDEKTLNQI